MEGRRAFARFIVRLTAMLALAGAARASDQVSYPFQGVRWTHRETTVPRPLEINVLQIDLDYPGVGTFVTPGNGDAPLDVDARKTTTFVNEFALQVGINADFFEPAASTHPEGTDLDVLGLGVSDGVEYSPHNGRPALYFDQQNVPGIARFTGAPPAEIFNAVGGDRIIVQAGAVTGEASGDTFADALHPRTFAGTTAGGETLILAVVDGRQTGYSEGMKLAEAAALLIEFGAWTGINLDGGGSSTLVFDPGAGPRIINSPSDLGGERVVANHLGLNALPIPTVSTPNGGEAWIRGTTQTITWDPQPPIAEVTLQYSTDNGATWVLIAEATPNDGSFEWTVPLVSSPACLVRLSDAALPELYDDSDGTFAILGVDAYVQGDPRLTFGTVAGGSSADTEVADGRCMVMTEGSCGAGALKLQAEFALQTAASRAQISSLVLRSVATWTDLDGAADALRVFCAEASGGAWTEITGAIRSTGFWSPAAPQAYVSDGGVIRVIFTDTAAVRKEKRGSLAVDLLYATIVAGPPDMVPPAQPTGLTAVPGYRKVLLDWGDNPDTDLAGYNVYRATVPDGTYAQIATRIPTSEFTDAGLTNGQTYSYVVCAVDTSSNESAESDPVSATPFEDGTQTLHVASVQMSTEAVRKNMRAVARLLLCDGPGTPVAGAVITGQWFLDGAFLESAVSLPTDSAGWVSVASTPRRVTSGQTFTFVVLDVALAGYIYDPAGNLPGPEDYRIQVP